MPSPEVSASPSPSPTAAISPTPTPTPTPSPTEPPSELTVFERFDELAKTPGLQTIGGNIEESVRVGEHREVRRDFDGDGAEETLVIDVSLIDDPDGNGPKRIVFTVNGVELVYENTWNDGITIDITDFDERDRYLDIYLYASGTDIVGRGTVYRYDGERITEIAYFCVVTNAICTDGQGHIYHINEGGENYELLEYDIATGTDTIYVKNT
jgi:hypothetical protein